MKIPMINQTFNRYLCHHEDVLEHLLAKAVIPAQRLRAAMHYVLFPAGKRLRPLLVYLCGEIAEVNLATLDLIAAALELTHCYSLVHDDLPAMDDDDLRRGKLSCHKAFDEATAILVGDGLQALALDILLQELPQSLTAEQVIAVSRELVSASGPAGMVSGQSLDLSELIKPTICENELRTIHSLKTGRLISACVTMVLAAATPSIELKKALQNYALHLGLVFQMQDDYLDYYGENNALGKGRASDNANQKQTFASLYPKDALLELVNEYFHLAKDALAPLGNKARHLINLTNSLQARSQSSSPAANLSPYSQKVLVEV